MPDASEYLIECEAHTGSAPIMLRFSTSGYVTGPGDTPANTHYARVIANPGAFRRSLFSEGKTLGMPEINYGANEIVNVDGSLDALLNYGFDGRVFVVRRLANRKAAFKGAETILKATVEGIDTIDAMKSLRFRLYDRMIELDKPLQGNRYGGTTTSGASSNVADGTPDLKDAIRPLCYGAVRSVPAICVNPFDLIYQVHDGAVSLITVYDGGLPLTNKGDVTTAAALKAMTLQAGQYATCLKLGLFRLGGAPAQVITADVVEGSKLSLRNAGTIAQRVLAKAGISGRANLNLATFSALASGATAELGIFVNTDETALSVLGKVLGSIGGWVVPSPTGVFEVGRLTAPGTSVWSLDKHSIRSELGLIQNPDTDKNLPAWRVIVRYGRVWQTLEEGQFEECVERDRRVAFTKEFREAKSDAASVKTKHKLAPELRIDTLITNVIDAVAEASRRLNLYKVRRDVLTCSVSLNDARKMVLGSTGTVTLDRLGYDDGRDMVVIGLAPDPATEQVGITLWG